ncbi:MAG: hypothetical protein H0V49_08650 [Nocardioidaceae bacterium]|nr:hypothetical protein [Nocardioidaceae bacterium]
MVVDCLWGIAAGAILGYCVMLPYGLPLLGVLALAILFAARNYRPLPWALGAALLVVLGFAAAGFAWWEAFPVLRDRYWDGIAQRRPATYWLWGNLAAFCFSAGPMAGVATAMAVRRLAGGGRAASPYRHERVVVLLSCAAILTVGIADFSLMSKAEVERIWLPFVPWLLVGCALLPDRWQRTFLAWQVGFAVAVQHLIFTPW